MKPEDKWDNGTNGAVRLPSTEPLPPGINAGLEKLAKRINPILSERKTQLNTNLLGLNGGQPYVDARLSRFPGEPLTSFEGGKTFGGQTITGRKKQAHCIPYLRRTAEKVNQFVLGQRVNRKGIDEDYAKDITRQGDSIDAFMRKVNTQITACGWCWIGVDKPAIPADIAAQGMTQADAERLALRPYWQLYTALQVVDWCWDEQGKLRWILTEGEALDNSNPFADPLKYNIRRLWRKTDTGVTLTVIRFGGSQAAISVDTPIDLEYPEIPFVAVGDINAEPHLFDSLEQINRTLMDLNSCSRQNFFEHVFPQRYFPASMENRLQKARQEGDSQATIGGVVGGHIAVYIGEGEQPPGIVTPNGADLAAVREECTALKTEFLETAGLMIRKNGAASESAEAKAWDHLDIEAGLRERAQELQEAENEAATITGAMTGNAQPAWVAEYPQSFEVRDYEAEIRSLVMLDNISMPDEMRQEILQKALDALDAIGNKMTAERRAKILKALDGFTAEISVPIEPQSAPVPPGPDPTEQPGTEDKE